jgi:4-amino-4-deoxy-L-arabinose transferase-like glycosyltransferase
MRKIPRPVIGALGTLLLAAGQLSVARGDSAAHAWVTHLGRMGAWLVSPGLFPTGIGFGLALVTLGGLCVALALPGGTVLSSTAAVLEPRPRAQPSRWDNVAMAAFVACVILSATAAVLITRPEPGTATVVVWMGAVGSGLAGCLLVDRAQGRLPRVNLSRGEMAGLCALTMLCLMLVAYDLSDWHWAGTPDEASFFIVAKRIAEGEASPFPLSPYGVFGFQPVLSSYYQVLFMKLFGMDIMGWRLSSAVALALSLPFLYLAVRDVWSARAGVFAAIFLGTAQLAVGFADYGYNNAQVFPVITGSLAAMVCCTRRRSLGGYYLAGLIAGLGFMTYYVAIIAIPLVIFAGVSLGRLSWRPDRRSEVMALIVPLFLCVMPLLASPGATLAVASLLTLPTGASIADPGSWATALWAADGPVLRPLHHWLLSVVYGLWFPGPHHFQTNPVVDPVSGALATVGFWLSMRGLVRRSADGFVGVAYLAAAFIAGAVTPHGRPPLTRLLVLAPLTAVLAATALDLLLQVLPRRALGWTVGLLLVAATAAWNVTTLNRSVYERHHGFGDGTTSELIRLAQETPEEQVIYYVQPSHTFMRSVPDIMEQYGLRQRLHHLWGFTPAALTTLSQATPPFFAAHHLRAPEPQQAVERALLERFPNIEWRDSAPGKPWNLRFFQVDERR